MTNDLNNTCGKARIVVGMLVPALISSTPPYFWTTPHLMTWKSNTSRIQLATPIITIATGISLLYIVKYYTVSFLVCCLLGVCRMYS